VEYTAHLLLKAGVRSEVPLVVNGLPVGPGPRGRAVVSIDFSHVGDPLDFRFIRSAFGTWWGDRWERRMQTSMRAAFEARVYAGLVATGADRLVDQLRVGAGERPVSRRRFPKSCPRS